MDTLKSLSHIELTGNDTDKTISKLLDWGDNEKIHTWKRERRGGRDSGSEKMICSWTCMYI